jgi:hypothetical protein
MEKVKIKRIVFNNSLPDFIFSCEQWYSYGGYKQIIKDNSLCIADIKEVITEDMPEKEFYSLNSWEG